MATFVVTFALAFVAATGTARAQDATRWGVVGSFVPTWKIADQLSDLLIAVDRDVQASAVDIRGSEFRIGVARGRELGGDWSLSLVRKRFRDSRVAQTDQFEFFDGRRTVVQSSGFAYDLNEVTLTGIEYQRFRPFATIKERVQIGLTYGGGVGWLGGQARGVEFDPERGMQTVERPADALFSEGEVGLFSVMDYTLKPVPLARLELSVAGLVLPGVKVRASGGFNFPGYQVGSISVVYLFGSR
jgi:hypothetical protein